MRKAARAICELGPKNVVIKGGHLPGSSDAVDILFDGNSMRELRSPRIETKNTHGTGCTFASAITAELAKGESVPEAVRIAKEYLSEVIRLSAHDSLGHGDGPMNHMAILIRD
jgi:hydroxymethylpyrimidine kinase/phosphomethylpyrimidine kinase